jgi:hypothetical protein
MAVPMSRIISAASADTGGGQRGRVTDANQKSGVLRLPCYHPSWAWSSRPAQNGDSSPLTEDLHPILDSYSRYPRFLLGCSQPTWASFLRPMLPLTSSTASQHQEVLRSPSQSHRDSISNKMSQTHRTPCGEGRTGQDVPPSLVQMGRRSHREEHALA